MKAQKIISIIGLRHSGTTALASALGAHPDISMMAECYTLDFLKQVGTKYIGNKIIIGSFDPTRKRLPIIGAIINRIVGLCWKGGIQKYRLFPIADFTVNELIEMSDVVIVISRIKKDILKSNRKRENIKSILFLNFRYKRWERRWNKLKFDNSWTIVVHYDRMIANPEAALKELLIRLKLSNNKIVLKRMLDGAKYNRNYKKPLTM